MLRQSKLVAALELKNLFGLNTLRHTKDKSVKNRAVLLGIAWVLVILMVAGYVGGLAYGLVILGLERILGAYLVMIASLIILMFGMFKAGDMIFHRSGYDILSSLPLKQEAIVIGRFVRMYVEDFLMALMALLPGFVVYAILVRPAWYIYLFWLVAAFLIPLLPLSLATLLGIVISGVSSRMKNKSLSQVILSLAIVLGVFWFSSVMGTSAESLTPEMLANLAETVAELIGRVYPPALWLGNAMYAGSVVSLALCAAVYLAVFAAVMLLAARNFHAICRRLSVTTAKHNYRMEHQKQSSALKSLWLRELKRYFASGAYVTNTIMGPIMGTVLAGAYLIAGQESVNNLLGIELDLGAWLPFLVGGAFAMMPATAVSISMEGKNWWITKTLPLPTKTVLNAKLLMNLSLMLPFYIVSEVLMALALKPGIVELLWMLVIPALLIVFACVFGITANLLLPNFNWDNEVAVVKQSAAAAVGGFGGLIATLVFALAVGFLPIQNSHSVKLIGSLVLLGATVLLCHRNNKTDLRKL